MKPWRLELFLLLSITAGLIWSGTAPFDRFTWWLETAPSDSSSGTTREELGGHLTDLLWGAYSGATA